MKKNKSNMPAIIVLAFLTAAGFFFVLSKIGTLSTDMQNLKLQLDISEKNNQIIQEQKSLDAENASSTATATQVDNSRSIKISTAILFNTLSSKALLPQTNLTIAVQNVTKNTDGVLTINLKVFTNKASGYSALDPKSIFQIINFDRENLKPTKLNGQFSSMPPKSSTTGNVIFNSDPDKNKIIIQIGEGDNAKFYEFNFLNKTYKETTIG